MQAAGELSARDTGVELLVAALVGCRQFVRVS
jgi:hypothetical protein